jgi:fluoride exporter
MTSSVAPARDRLPLGLWVAAGSGAGAVVRLHLGSWVAAWTAGGFPWPTLAINVTGSILLGFLFRALPAPATSAAYRALLLIGFCGGYTTFSTFDLETWRLLQHGRYVAAAAYSMGSVLACVGGVYCGALLATALRQRLRRST